MNFYLIDFKKKFNKKLRVEKENRKMAWASGWFGVFYWGGDGVVWVQLGWGSLREKEEREDIKDEKMGLTYHVNN